jgi:hypothetical protein
MNLAIAQQNTVVALSAAHADFSVAILGMFNWFQEAVKGNSAVLNFDDEFNARNVLTEDPNMPERLKNEWSSFARSLRSAYADFGGEVVKRMGVDEPAQVRNLALSIAGSSFTRARNSAREFLVQQVESTVLPS